jgi:tRNA (cytidine/uridine-2'-O-)-methyltransferase
VEPRIIADPTQRSTGLDPPVPARLRGVAEPRFHLVLLSPEIPNNTGNIGRTAAATGCRLHIIHPIAFEMTEKARRRAGLDYWDLVDCVEHESWEAFIETERPERLWLYTTRADRPHWEADFRPCDYMLFGRETKGVPVSVHDWVRRTYGENHRITLPMVDDPRARSLNLATAVCAAVYEGLRQLQTAEGRD